MTVIVEDPDSHLLMVYTKGADFAIFERLSESVEQHFLEATKEDLIKFSTKGYRTLCFAIRVIDKSYYEGWSKRLHEAKLQGIKVVGDLTQMKLQEQEIEKLYAEIESDLFLLGATALEDKLQEGVAEAIDDFNQAGIKVWMLTGDKLETAENIGFSSKMFNEKMFIFKCQAKEKKEVKSRLMQIEHKINEIEKQQ